MTTISIIGKGNMGTAIGGILSSGGANVEYVGRDASEQINGDIVILAVPITSEADIVATHGSKLAGKTVVEISNPLNPDTFDSLTPPADSSAAHQLAALLPESKILKAFNTNFGPTLATKTIAGQPTTVLIAGDDQAGKETLAAALAAGGVNPVDVGALKRARELEALAFVQLTLLIQEKIGFNGGFALIK